MNPDSLDPSNDREIVFVYNADSGFFNLIKDVVNKAVSPSTYPCRLCALTFGNLGMRSPWKQFIDSIAISVTFLHKDEFIEQYGAATDAPTADYPCAFLEEDDSLALFISAEEIEDCSDLEELIALTSEKIAQLDPLQ